MKYAVLFGHSRPRVYRREIGPWQRLNAVDCQWAWIYDDLAGVERKDMSALDVFEWLRESRYSTYVFKWFVLSI